MRTVVFEVKFPASASCLVSLFVEEIVQKRLARGRERPRELGPSLETPSLASLQVRREALLRIVYLLFNE